MTDNPKTAKKLHRLEQKLEKAVAKAPLADVGEALSENFKQNIDTAIKRFGLAIKNAEALIGSEHSSSDMLVHGMLRVEDAKFGVVSSGAQYGIYKASLGLAEQYSSITPKVLEAALTTSEGDSKAVKKLKGLIDKVEEVSGTEVSGHAAVQLLRKNPELKISSPQRKPAPVREI